MINKMEKTFILVNITPPVFKDGKEYCPPGYIIFPSLRHYKKIKNLDSIIRHFLKRLQEIKNNKVFKCLDLIESLVDDCGKVGLVTEDEKTFVIVFSGIVNFIELVGFGFGQGEKNDKLYDVGINMRFDDNISGKVKHKYCTILHKLYDQNIWPIGLFV